MNIEELIDQNSEFIGRYAQVSGALMTLLSDEEYPSAAENLIELCKLLEAQSETWKNIRDSILSQ